MERFRQVSAAVNRVGYPVVVVGGKDDREQGEVIVSGGFGLNLAGRTSLAETAAVLGRSRLLVSGDSGVLHLAVGLGVRTVFPVRTGNCRKVGAQGRKAHRVEPAPRVFPMHEIRYNSPMSLWREVYERDNSRAGN